MGSRRLVAAVVAGGVVVLGAAMLVRRGAERPDQPQGATAGARTDVRAAAARGGQHEATEAPAAGAGEDPFPGLDDAFATPWGDVDLDAARAAMPNNLYWEMSVPTSDPEIARLRQEERDRWNVQYGKVLSGTGTEEEIHAYFKHRQRLSSDYIEFAMYLLEHYVDILPERDYGLLELAVRLHQARLEEIPRRLAEALERKRRQDALREAWRRDEAAFEHPGDRGESE